MLVRWRASPAQKQIFGTYNTCTPWHLRAGGLIITSSDEGNREGTLTDMCVADSLVDLLKDLLPHLRGHTM